MDHRNVKGILKNVIEKCDIIYSNDLYGDCVISKESLLVAFSEFFSESLSRDERKTGIVMHTDSICFDILAVVFSAVVNILYSNVDTMDVIESLNEGDIVFYRNEKYRFVGKVDFDNKPSDEYIKLMKDDNKQSTNNFTYIFKKYSR